MNASGWLLVLLGVVVVSQVTLGGALDRVGLT